MSATAAGLIQIGILFTALAACRRPLGDHMARVYTSTRHLAVERLLYRGAGVDAGIEQRWPVYVRSVLAFSLVSILVLYALQRLQQHLWLSIGMPPVDPDQAWNTAVSFVTNTNWQSYSGESTMSHLTQMAGLAVQNFLSAAVGMAVAVAVIRGLVRSRTDELGNFWVDLVRGTVRILLPLSFVVALVLVAGGVVQNLTGATEVHALAGGTQSIPGGPVASQEAIKELGTNGGGFFNANSAHPFEGPNAAVSLFEIFALLLIPVSLTRTFGTMVGNTRQGLAILGAMAALYTVVLAGVSIAEAQGSGTAAQAAGAAMEGKETRFGVWLSALFAASTTGTSTGSVNSFHDSFTPFGGGGVLFNMLLGEVTPGGVGSGLYGMLVLAMLAIFLGGLMVGRTPEYLGKKLRSREIRLIAMYILTTPALVLTGTALGVAFPSTRESMTNTGPHGLSEVMYGFASGANNNGSAFAGLGADTYFFNTGIGLAMLFGRLLPIIFVLALAGSLARQRTVPAGEGTLPTHRPMFAVMLVATVLIVAGLTYFPALALGPLAEGLS